MAFFANIFGYLLNFLYDFINNYGVAMIVFSIVLKLLLLPISIKQQKTMTKSAEVQEEVKLIQKKYKNNPEKLNQATMDLYKSKKMSPFSGCLSSIIQIIIFISVFYLVSKPLSYMKKIDPQVIDTYKQEIAAQEEGSSNNYPEIKIIKEKSGEDERVAINMNFLGLNLSDVPTQNLSDPRVYVIPVLYVVSSFFSMRYTTMVQKKKKDEDDKEEKNEQEDTMEAMQSATKSMQYMMPIMSVVISFIAPLGLSLYWLTNNLLTLTEKIIITKVVKSREEDKDA